MVQSEHIGRTRHKFVRETRLTQIQHPLVGEWSVAEAAGVAHRVAHDLSTLSRQSLSENPGLTGMPNSARRSSKQSRALWVIGLASRLMFMMGRGFTLVAEAGSYIVAGAIADLTQVKLNERILDVDVRIRVVDVDSRNGL